MHALKAQVKNGRLVLDEPTDLPEGEVVELVPGAGIVSPSDDDMDEEERVISKLRARAGRPKLKADMRLPGRVSVGTGS